MGRIVGFELDDAFTVGPIKLGDKARVVLFNENEEHSLSKAVERMFQCGCVDRKTMQEIIRKAASFSELHTETVVNRVINEPDWSVNVELLASMLPDDNKYKTLLSNSGPLNISRNLDSPSQLIVIKEILKMGRLPMLYQCNGNASNVFARLSGTKPSEHKWRSSGLARYLRSRFNKENLSENKYHLHANTCWYDIERLLRICTEDNVDPRSARSALTQELARIQNRKERIKQALALISPNGILWKRLLKKTWKSPPAVLYTYSVLKKIKGELNALL